MTTAVTANGTRPRLLFVEDEEIVRNVIGRALSDYEVILVEDAERALDLMVADPAAIVITDIVLPRMDGCAMAARIREYSPGVPVLAVSGRVSDADVEEFGFDAFLAKPVDLQVLRATVADLLGRID